MATLLDVSILEYFGGLFVVFLVFLLTYGILEVTGPFKDKRGLNGIVALFVAFLFLIPKSASAMISVMVPWFIVLLIFIFFVMLLYRMFGVSEKDFREVIKMGSVYPWIIIFAILILISALSAVFGQYLLESGSGTEVTPGGSMNAQPVLNPGDPMSTSTPSFGTNVMNTLRHPKVLGMVFVFLTAAFVMIFLTRPAT